MILACTLECGRFRKSRLQTSGYLADVFRMAIPVIPAGSFVAKLNSYFGVKICSENFLCKLVHAANRFVVPPTRSQAFLPCDAAKNCHSAFS